MDHMDEHFELIDAQLTCVSEFISMHCRSTCDDTNVSLWIYGVNIVNSLFHDFVDVDLEDVVV